MSPGLKSLAALVAAAAMVGAAVVGRGALEDKKERDDLRLTVVCDPLALAFCEAAEAADDRITVEEESPDVTTKRLVALAVGERPDFQAWVSVGPWLQMADGRRTGQPRLEVKTEYIASTPVVLVTRLGQTLPPCSKPPAGCLPLPRSRVGLASPLVSGVGLAGLTQIVLASTGIPVDELDRNAVESGPAATTIDAVARSSDPNDSLGPQIAANFSLANPVVTTRAATGALAGRVAVIPSQPAVAAVLQIGLLDEAATVPLRGDGPAGRALARKAFDDGWGPADDPRGGLPEPGVLAAIQDEWPRR